MSKRSENVKNWRKRTKSLIIESMGNSCQICGYDKCDSALELHHIDPSKKEFSFAGFRAAPRAIDKIRDELKKCILLCSNCHREVHSGITCLPTDFSTFDEELFNMKKIKTRKVPVKKVKKEKVKKINLDDETLLYKLQNEYNGNKSKMARDIGVSETAIRKRIKVISWIGTVATAPLL